jgi:hypothetical protein
MLGAIGLCLVAALLAVRFLLYPIVIYFIDLKGLRRYPNMTLFSGISNVPYMLESSRGFRSKRMTELHKVHPVIRIGPNSLSYGKVSAIKVS